MESETMKVHVNAARFFGGQGDRIEAGFRALGHEVVEHAHLADLVYSQDSHGQVLRDKACEALKPGAKVILCCLDVPTHLLPHFDVNALAAELRQADAVVTISQFGQWQVRTYCGLNSTVVWNPIKPVTRSPEKRYEPFPRFLSAARRSDRNKRFNLAVAALQLLGYDRSELALVGNEGGWGDYMGVLRDEDLNIAYNSADFVICMGRIEGLCLGVLEAMAAGAVPLIARDLSTREELLPTALFPEFAVVEPNPPSVARFIASLTNEDGGQRLADLKERLHVHYLANWQQKTSPTGVAHAILNVYETLT